MARQSLTFAALLVAFLFAGTNAFAPGRGLHFSKKTIGSNKIAFPQAVKTANFNNIQSTAQSSTSLQMATANPGFALAAITGAISGGLFAGGLHAIAGKLKTESQGETDRRFPDRDDRRLKS